jgi:glycosyltransferase involved in cell wall biosynthesis
MASRWRPDKADGVDQAVVWISRALMDLGSQVEIWEASKRHRKVGFRNTEEGIRVWELPIRAEGFRIPSETREFVSRESEQVRVVHFHSCFVAANTQMARILRCPYVVTPHGGYSRFRMKLRGALRKWVFFILFSRPYLENAAFVHVLSELEREAIADLCAQRRFVVATSGCVDFPESQAPWRDAGSGRRLLFIGRLDVDCKGLDRALHAFSVTAGPADHFTIAGPDFRRGMSKLQRMAQSFGITDRTTIRAGVFGSEKQRLMADSDIFVQLSRWDGVPLTPIEAMGIGRPILVTPETNLANYVADADAGWVAKGDCTDGMGECLRSTQSDLYKKGLNARQLVETEFQWSKTAERLLMAYPA